MGLAKVDMSKIKAEYVTGIGSLTQLAKKYGISYTQVSTASVTEGWVAARKRYRADAYQAAVTRAQAEEVDRLLKVRRATEDTISVVQEALANPEQLHMHVVSETDAEGSITVSERRFDKLDTKALRDISASLKELTSLLRAFYDIPTAAEAEQRQIALDKAKIERDKAAREASEAERDKVDTIRVVFDDGSPEEWNA